MTRPSPPAPFQNCGCTPLRVSAAGAPDGGASEGVSTGGVNAAGSLVAPLASLLLIILLLAGCGTGAEAGGVPGDRETDVRFPHEMAPTPPDLRGLPAGTVLTLEVVDVGGSAKGPARPGDRLHLRLVEPVVGMGERRVPAGARVVAVVGRDAGSLEVVELQLEDRRHGLRGRVESVLGGAPSADPGTDGSASNGPAMNGPVTTTGAAATGEGDPRSPTGDPRWAPGTGVAVMLTAPVPLP